MFRDWVQKSYAPVANDVLHMYAIPDPPDAREAFIRAATELEMSAPARWAAQAMREMKQRLSLRSDLGVSQPGRPAVGCVPQDGPLVDVRLSSCLRRDWRCFGPGPTRLLDTVCQDGKPEHTRVTRVAADYDAATASCLELGVKIRPTARLHQDAFGLIDRAHTTRLSRIRQ